MRNTFATFFLGILIFNATDLLACSSHPGMTHAQWTSSFETKKDKNGRIVDEDIFEKKNTAPPPQRQDGMRGRTPASRGEDGERRIRQVQ